MSAIPADSLRSPTRIAGPHLNFSVDHQVAVQLVLLLGRSGWRSQCMAACIGERSESMP